MSLFQKRSLHDQSPSSNDFSKENFLDQLNFFTQIFNVLAIWFFLVFSVINNFANQNDVDVSATEGNMALIPCTPPGGHPQGQTVFEVNSTTIDHTGSE